MKILYKVFSGLKPYNTAIHQVTINVTELNVADFHERTTSPLLEELPHFVIVQLDLSLHKLKKTARQEIKSSLKNFLMKTEVIKSVRLKATGYNKHPTIRNAYDGLFEGIAHGSSSVSNLDLNNVTIEDFKHLFSLLIRWNSSIRLDTLSISKNTAPNCHDQERCHESCTLLSTFLSKNVPLRKLDMLLPFEIKHFVNCIDTIQAVN